MSLLSRLALALGLTLAAAIVCRGAEPPQPSRTYVGELSGGPRSARIALVVQGTQVVAYACSQDQQFNQDHARWYEGELKDQRLTVKQDGYTLTARVEGDRARGTLVGPDGKELTFSAERTAPNSLAGLYRGVDQFDGDEHLLGWIVDAKHDVVGACKRKKKGPQVIQVITLRPVKRLPPPPPPEQLEIQPEQQPAQDDEQAQAQADQQSQQAQEALQVKVDPNAQAVVQAQKVVVLRKLPAGKKKPLPVKPK
jgi:hypothetical protein